MRDHSFGRVSTASNRNATLAVHFYYAVRTPSEFTQSHHARSGRGKRPSYPIRIIRDRRGAAAVTVEGRSNEITTRSKSGDKSRSESVAIATTCTNQLSSSKHQNESIKLATSV